MAYNGQSSQGYVPPHLRGMGGMVMGGPGGPVPGGALPMQAGGYMGGMPMPMGGPPMPYQGGGYQGGRFYGGGPPSR